MVAMNRRVAALAISVLLALPAVGCSGATAPATPSASVLSASDALLADNGLDGLSAEQVVDTLDADPRARPLPITGSVRPTEVILSDGSTEVRLPLGDQFRLSIAPYATRTHECFNHNLGTCQGELVDTPVHVTITADDGTVVVDEDATTKANGFVGFWVPRNLTGTVEITTDGRTGSAPFDSSADGATCMTTLRVA